MGFRHEVKSMFGFIIMLTYFGPDPQMDYVGGDSGAMVDMADEVWCWQNFFAQILLQFGSHGISSDPGMSRHKSMYDLKFLGPVGAGRYIAHLCWFTIMIPDHLQHIEMRWNLTPKQISEVIANPIRPISPNIRRKNRKFIIFQWIFQWISHGFPWGQAYVQALWSLATSRGLAVNSKGNKMRSAAATRRLQRGGTPMV